MTPQERERQAKRDWLVEFMQGSEASRCPATGTKIWDTLLGYPIFFCIGRTRTGGSNETTFHFVGNCRVPSPFFYKGLAFS